MIFNGLSGLQPFECRKALRIIRSINTGGLVDQDYCILSHTVPSHVILFHQKSTSSPKMEFSYTCEPVVRSSTQKPRVLLLGKTLHDGGEALRNSDRFEIHVSRSALSVGSTLRDRDANTAKDSRR